MAAPDVKQKFNSGAGLVVRRTPTTDKLVLRNVTLKRPAKDGDGNVLPWDQLETLVEPFSLTVEKGERLVLTGERGCGKSTLVKAIAGLPGITAAGEILVPANARILDVPQKPYLPDVPMRGILTYPDRYPDPKGENPTDEEMEDAMKLVGLGHYAHFIRDEKTTGAAYSRQFSLGEQQAIIFARILLYKPDILFLDEVTASLDKKSRMTLYQLLLDKLPDTTIVSIAHNEEVIPLHDRHAHIENKQMTVRPANEPLPPSAAPSSPGLNPT